MGVPRYHLTLNFGALKHKTDKLHSNTNSICCNSKFHPDGNKNGSKIVGKLSEGHLNVSDHLQRLPKIFEEKTKNGKRDSCPLGTGLKLGHGD